LFEASGAVPSAKRSLEAIARLDVAGPQCDRSP
jgi:hypothetical protein